MEQWSILEGDRNLPEQEVRSRILGADVGNGLKDHFPGGFELARPRGCLRVAQI